MLVLAQADAQLGPYLLGPNDTPENGIYTGNSQELARAIPDESVDLIVTDPPYNVGKDYGEGIDDNLSPEAFLDWYSWIPHESYRVLRNGYVYVSCSTNQLWTLRPLWEQAGFSFQMLLLWHGPNYAGNSNTIRMQWRLLYEPIMMFLKGTRPKMLNEVRGLQTDAILRFTRPQRSFSGELKRVHACQKPLGLYHTIIGRTPGEVVLDWFVGSGTSAMAAKVCGRRWLGFDLNLNTSMTARKRIEETNAPLFVMRPEQVEMTLCT